MRCPWGAEPILPVGRKAGGFRGAHWVLRTMPQKHLKGPKTKIRVTGQLSPQCLSDYGRILASHLFTQPTLTKCLLCAPTVCVRVEGAQGQPGGLCIQALGSMPPSNLPPPAGASCFLFSKTGMRETMPLSQGY